MKRIAKNSTYMKLANRKQILGMIRKEPVSRAELARKTGLTRATITLIIDELVKEGIVVETIKGTSDYGRKPVLLDINPFCGYAIGLNITRGGYFIGIINIKGEIVLNREIDVSGACDASEAIETITSELNRLIEDAKIGKDKILGIGVSSPGPVEVYTGQILNPPNFSMWHGVNIVEELKKFFPYNIYLENNSTAITLAEKNYGKGSQYGSFILLLVDTGIGAGIVIDDKLYRGMGGFGSEIGHTSIDIKGELCDCGNRGCLELYASIPAILKSPQIHDAGISSWKDVVNRAEEGDGFCIDLIDREASYLAAGIVNAVNILEPEALILAGYISYRPRMLLDKLRKIIGNTMITRNIRKLLITESSVSDDSGVVPAASVVIDKFFSIGW